MSGIDIETKRKLREMGATPLLEALETQDETLTLGMAFGERLRLVVDEAHSTFNHAKIEGLIRRAGLRYPDADLRRLDLVSERGLNREVIAQLATCTFIERHENVVFQGFTGSGKSYLGSALATQGPASTGSGRTTSGCQTWKKRGRWPATRPTGPRSS